MTLRRLAIYVVLLLILAVAGLVLTDWALAACAPPPLPGDELWSARQNLGEALSLIFRLGSKACFLPTPAAATALWLGARTAGVVLVVLALIVLWESLGRELRLSWFRARGGHVLLAGTADDLAGLTEEQGRLAGTFYLAPDRGAAADIARARPFAEIVLVRSKSLSAQLARLGAPRAKLVAAATRNDLVNVAIAESALDRPGSGEFLLRLEQGSVRALSSHRLRQRAEKLGRSLSVVSLTHLQTRLGMAAAMAGRYSIDGSPRVHIALCGTGPGLQAAAMEIVRQGFGLETERPILSILRTGSEDFAAGALERLQSSDAVAIQVSTAFADAAGGLDSAISGIVLDNPPLRAVYSVGDTPEEAEAMALRWEEVLLALSQPVPPIISFAADDREMGTTGMIRVAAVPDLAEARDLARLMDARAIAVHNDFLRAQRLARGDKFGTAPAELEWPELPETFRDDNRNVTDQLDFTLARIFMLARPSEGGAVLTPDETETLAGIAHARWLAARALAGWHYGPARDERQQLHPDMLPYADLTEAARQKDRDQVGTLAAMATLASESLKRERRVGMPQPLDTAALAALRNNLALTAKDQVPVAVLPLDDAAVLGLAETLLADGVLVEAVLGQGITLLRRDLATAARLAEVLRNAWRIHIAPGRDGRAALADRAAETVDERGAIHALV